MASFCHLPCLPFEYFSWCGYYRSLSLPLQSYSVDNESFVDVVFCGVGHICVTKPGKESCCSVCHVVYCKIYWCTQLRRWLFPAHAGILGMHIGNPDLLLACSYKVEKSSLVFTFFDWPGGSEFLVHSNACNGCYVPCTKWVWLWRISQLPPLNTGL